jgi:hypothetical protein
MRCQPQVLCVILVTLLSACSSGKDTQTAEQAVEKFRRQMAASDFADIYADAAPEWRNSVSAANSDVFLRAVTTKLGSVKSSAQTGWSDIFSSSGHRVTLHYHTEFDGGGADETFTIGVDGNSGQLVGYHIDSMAMMTK